MLKSGILNAQLLRVLGEAGHMDLFMLSDAAMPIPMGKERVDLAIINDLPRQLTVLKAIVEQLQLEKIYMAEEIQRVSPVYFGKVRAFVEAKGIPLELIPHETLKARSASKEVRACIRTGERTSYSTMLLQVGVPYGGDDQTGFTIEA